MQLSIKQQILEILKRAEVEADESDISVPPNPEMGDFAFACFAVAKKQGKNPVEIASELAQTIAPQGVVEKVAAAGPYVNFYLDGAEVAKNILAAIQTNAAYGSFDLGKNKTILVEYGCPNPMKVFHLGHLRNLIAGEAAARMFENAGYDVKRVNYQGDVGMHIAKSLWGIDQMKSEFDQMKSENPKEQVAFLGKAYAYGATKYEEDEEAKKEILAYNRKVYEHDSGIIDTYKTARAWSLEYFDTIYAKLGSTFDRLYFESEVFEPGKKIVEEGLERGVFKKSQGAVIFEGSLHGLHDRVFINSEGFTTYEAKDIGLGKLHFREFNPEMVIHVVGKEQTDYFKVVFKALSEVVPESTGKEYHIVGGYLQLKGDQKMSSRKGNVVSGDELIRMVEDRVRDIMKDRDLEHKEEAVRKISVAALKYSMLKVGVSQDIAFDLGESVSTAGDSGPYLLYIVTRIRGILDKVDVIEKSELQIPDTISLEEKQLVLELSRFEDVTRRAVEEYDPSYIAKYVFGLAQTFNRFYQACPVLQAQGKEQLFRIALVKSVDVVMRRGLYLLGVETVEQM